MKRIIELPDDVVKAIQNGEDYRYDIHTAIAQSKPYDEAEVWRKSNELLKKRLRYLGNSTGDLISRSALLNQIDTADWSDVRLLVEDAPTVEPFTQLEKEEIADAINYLLDAELLEENGYTEEVIKALKSALKKVGGAE